MAAWTTVVAAALTRATAVVPVPAGRVIRGHDVSDSADDAVVIALQNIDDEGWTSAGTFRQSMQSFGGKREEVGSVNGLVYARDGGGNQATATDTALGYLAALEADVRADPTLGIPVGDGHTYDYMVTEMDSGEIREIQANDGASTALPFVISYKTRIN